MIAVHNRWKPDELCLYDLVISRKTALLMLVFVGLCTIVIVTIYSYMMLIARQHMRRIQPLSGAGGPHEEAAESHAFYTALVNHLKLAKTFGIVVGAFIVCWTPFLLIMALNLAGIRHDLLDMLLGVDYLLAYCNSFMSFLIYAGRSSQFHSAFWAVLPSR
ncbi:PREDICTED: melanocortin receptor 4-like [Priapulus caudatus]|uniref:Melanocortin receptor 4-like n=1 Tax=Priapulus caudatus TaxID=37621 RepID=A0ABM1EF76_PRICU|nr:PREDICTED: melanocortin receptor 4-like [Priapulus caudatus]